MSRKYLGGITMLDGAFTRGTTPTQIFELPQAVDMSDLKDFTITYKQRKNIVLIKRKGDTITPSEIDPERNIVITLSQSDTLMFDPRINKVEVQIKAISNNGDVFVMGNYKLRLEDCFDEEEIGIY